MPRHLLSFFCLSLLLLGCTCGAVYAANGVPVKSAPLFVPGKRVNHDDVNGNLTQTNISSFDLPFLAASDGVMVAFSEARFHKSICDTPTNVLGLIDTKEQNWLDNIITGKMWTYQWSNHIDEGIHYAHRNPAAVIKGNKIYVLRLSNQGPDGSIVPDNWYLELTVGEIGGLPVRNVIQWETTWSLHLNLRQKVDEQLLRVFPSSTHSAFLTIKKTVVFSVRAMNKENESGYAIMQLKDNEEQWGVSFVEKPTGCSFFSLFEWREKLISIVSGCRNGDIYVKEYDEVKEEWKDADDALFHVWRSKYTFERLSHVTIGYMNVLLFTEKPWCVNDKCKMPLWFSDGNRVHRAGLIETEYDKAAFGRFVYTNGELYFLHHQKIQGKEPIVLTRLDDERRTMLTVLNIWAKKDAYLSKPCNATAPEVVSSDTLCVTPVPTDGLVGFFSDKGNHTRWHDEYRVMNAIVNNATKVKNGYKFSGTGNRVEWPVGRRKHGAWYDFTKYGLTILATVVIHETPKGSSPLITLYEVRQSDIWGMWYRDGEWRVGSKNGNAGAAIGLETQKEYRVALVLHNNNISVYVNGKLQGSPWRLPLSSARPFDIKSIFIGGWSSGEKINMTVTNVLLYNRVLNDTELEAASKRIAPAKATSPEETPATPTSPEETPATPTSSEETLKTPTSSEETPATPTSSEETPATPTSSEETPETPTSPKETLKTPTDPKETPKTPTDPKETPGTPTDPKEDSCEHVRMGASLLFLLGLRAFALLFSAPI